MLAGAHDVDEHFRTAPFEENIPVMLGLTGVWNTTFLGYPSLAILPYTQALSKLAPHIQQVRSSLLIMPYILCLITERQQGILSRTSCSV